MQSGFEAMSSEVLWAPHHTGAGKIFVWLTECGAICTNHLYKYLLLLEQETDPARAIPSFPSTGDCVTLKWWAPGAAGEYLSVIHSSP